MFCHVVGLVLAVFGAGLLAAVLIVPAWQQNRELAWRRDLLRLHADGMLKQEEAYHETLSALQAEDPALLERLAYGYLRLKPAGADMAGLDGLDTAHRGNPERHPGTIEAFLARPEPQVGRDIAPLAPLTPLQARLARLTSGTTRSIAIALGFISILLGLTLPSGGQDAPGEPEAPAKARSGMSRLRMGVDPRRH